MTTYQEWIDKIDALITMMKCLDYEKSITMSFDMKDLIELKLIITTCKELANDKGKEIAQ